MTRRSPRDGRPFYCSLCGAGYGEYMACEEPDCELESEASAKSRQTAATKDPVTKEAKTLEPGDSVRMDDDTYRTVKEVTHEFPLFIKGVDPIRGVIIYWEEGNWSYATRDFKAELRSD